MSVALLINSNHTRQCDQIGPQSCGENDQEIMRDNRESFQDKLDR